MNTKKLVALTFDDGPNTTTTMQVIDVLERHGITASFFVVGNNINADSEKSMQRAVSIGCEIENHSRTHSVMTEQTADVIAAEIDFTSDKVEAAVGRRPEFFRPPYIAYNEIMYNTIDMTFICGVGADDWNDEVSADERFERIVEQVIHGTIILLHDMDGNSKTVEAIEKIIPRLKADGYEFVTVSQLFRQCGVTPKRNCIYSNVFVE